MIDNMWSTYILDDDNNKIIFQQSWNEQYVQDMGDVKPLSSRNIPLYWGWGGEVEKYQIKPHKKQYKT